jgi:hypothetical protein
MDYKQTHPEPPVWDSNAFYPQCALNAYGEGDVSGLFEVYAPDRSVRFLGIHGLFDESAGLFYFFGIDSPQTSPERQAFEWGKMSWIDFWFHKPWLLRMVVPLNPGQVVTSYINPSDMPKRLIEAFHWYGNRGPYIMRRDQLLIALKNTSFNGDDPVEAERSYLEFMALYGHRFTDNAA